MQAYIGLLVLLLIFFFSGVVDWFQIKLENGVYYKDNWIKTVLAVVGFIFIMYFQGDLMGDWIFWVAGALFVFSVVILPIKGNKNNLIIYSTSKNNVEHLLEYHLWKYEVPFVAERIEGEERIYFEIEGSNEKIKMEWEESQFKEENEHTVKLHIKRSRHSSNLIEVLADTKMELQKQQNPGVLKKRLMWLGGLLIFGTGFGVFFFIALLLGY
ncbi:hypothetical protein ACM26V_09175 [Salipaludibacillus sp. HK11]|uniref:hypothetical protein n=1 Tax=Salipaludibacillus sp. HK11 TaxID=3394320 RepID=UPI0039FC1A8F